MNTEDNNELEVVGIAVVYRVRVKSNAMRGFWHRDYEAVKVMAQTALRDRGIDPDALRFDVSLTNYDEALVECSEVLV